MLQKFCLLGRQTAEARRLLTVMTFSVLLGLQVPTAASAATSTTNPSFVCMGGEQSSPDCRANAKCNWGSFGDLNHDAKVDILDYNLCMEGAAG